MERDLGGKGGSGREKWILGDMEIDLGGREGWREGVRKGGSRRHWKEYD